MCQVKLTKSLAAELTDLGLSVANDPWTLVSSGLAPVAR